MRRDDEEVRLLSSSEEDWSSIQETQYIMSVPGLYELIKRGIEEPLSECSRDFSW